MSKPTIREAATEDSSRIINKEDQAQKQPSRLASLRNYALAGAAATFLLSFVEWIDSNIQLSPVFESFNERLVFTSYFSLNLLVGSIIGLLVGFCAHAASTLKRLTEIVLTKGGEARLIHKLGAWLAVAAMAAVFFNQQSNVNGYAISLLREAEKFPRLATPIVAIEGLLSYFVVMGLLLAASIVWALTRASANWPANLRRAWMLGLLLTIAGAYYADSRIEVQQYEYSLHRTMFLIDVMLAMALVGTVYISSTRIRSFWPGINPKLRKSFAALALILLISAIAFTFARFDNNQNLKTQVFYRSTQAKQHFKLAQWALDFDRDGYSALLGGGDTDDGRASINPGAMEVIGDGIDNNCIGGDLTQESIDEWQRQFTSLRAVANPSPQRYNVIYFFIDTLRPDHLGTHGYHRNTSPNIDKLAARSSVFLNAYTPSPYTYEAAPKFMQSTYWDAHLETWTEALARNGYRTILFPRRLSMLLRHVKGMQQIVDAARKGLKQTIDAAIDELGKVPADKPFCAYIYSSDPHRPYKRHAEFNFGSSLTDQYDGEIAYTDYELGRLFDWMEKSGRINDTMVIIMSDHGESFGERMVYKHNSVLYDEQMRVPMIFYVPGLAPRRVADYVTTVDLGTTILNIAGLESAKDSAGVSLLPLMRGEPLSHPPVYGEHDMVENSVFVSQDKWVEPESRKYMVVTQDGYKLIYNRNFYNFELYDLRADPKEERNLYERMPEKAAKMKKLLGRFVDVVVVKRPADADEQKAFGGAQDDEDQK